jgi:hypothetical protein
MAPMVILVRAAVARVQVGRRRGVSDRVAAQGALAAAEALPERRAREEEHPSHYWFGTVPCNSSRAHSHPRPVVRAGRAETGARRVLADRALSGGSMQRVEWQTRGRAALVAPEALVAREAVAPVALLIPSCTTAPRPPSKEPLPRRRARAARKVVAVRHPGARKHRMGPTERPQQCSKYPDPTSSALVHRAETTRVSSKASR